MSGPMCGPVLDPDRKAGSPCWSPNLWTKRNPWKKIGGGQRCTYPEDNDILCQASMLHVLHTCVAGIDWGTSVLKHKYHHHSNQEGPEVGFGGLHQLSPFWGGGLAKGLYRPPPPQSPVWILGNVPPMSRSILDCPPFWLSLGRMVNPSFPRKILSSFEFYDFD